MLDLLHLFSYVRITYSFHVLIRWFTEGSSDFSNVKTFVVKVNYREIICFMYKIGIYHVWRL